MSQGGSEKGIGTFDMMRRGLPNWVSDKRSLMRDFYETKSRRSSKIFGRIAYILYKKEGKKESEV
jgi:hypothetical protein